MSRAQEIVDYWMGLKGHLQFAQNAEFDALLKTRFEQDVTRALDGTYKEWLTSGTGTLAFILLLDQINRNIYRGTEAAYQGDTEAVKAAHTAVELGYDEQASSQQRMWFYMPFMHSENMEDQERSVALCTAHGMSTGYARHHRDIIRRFGRFPHRNSILGRRSTPAEEQFIREGGFSG